MVGDRLLRISRWLVREDTYATVVVPAVADLQHEAAHGTWPRVRACAGAWRGILGATAQELASDCVAVLNGLRLRPALGPSAATLVGLTLLMVGPVHWNGVQPWHHKAFLLLVMMPVLLAFTLPAAGLPFAAACARVPQADAKRAALVLGSTVLIATTTGNYVLTQRIEPLATELQAAAIMTAHPTRAPRTTAVAHPKCAETEIDARLELQWLEHRQDDQRLRARKRTAERRDLWLATH